MIKERERERKKEKGRENQPLIPPALGHQMVLAPHCLIIISESTKPGSETPLNDHTLALQRQGHAFAGSF